MAWIWKKSVIATSLIALLSLFVLVVNYSEKPYFLLQPMLGHSLSSPWMLFRQNHKVYKPHVGYISIPKQEPLKLHCDVCSVVSSSGQMLGQGAGLDIDHSSCIWRMNSAPTRGFERDVGRRTTLRMVSHTSVPLLLQRPQHFFGQANDTVYVVWGPLRNMRQDGKGIVYNMLRQAAENFPQARIFVTTEERMNYCDKVFKKETGKDRIQSGSYLSTGWFTLILAMDMCKEIHVYGMINDTYCNHGVEVTRGKVSWNSCWTLSLVPWRVRLAPACSVLEESIGPRATGRCPITTMRQAVVTSAPSTSCTRARRTAATASSRKRPSSPNGPRPTTSSSSTPNGSFHDPGTSTRPCHQMWPRVPLFLL
ncbi:alpha-N-acetylgalactosaminide alpha-2,6-sialyltransferase 3-like isoform X2 [Denticeps clupeoides]|uniref:alpha-N-acetylgalactosaminide alpha-2,6-sialyltransferase 3-like isoform X2 n=1 Tax=Denticeps clupeoides TaxID=299321 RepID=UPI0010A3B59B|nr:alpha-N-acetylgalactosaminide alpha-2,6-sialyltransferase 3-like isoform X2 [Denticeps clupeoides]